ncbi:uncharacterized protein Triagg1_581 [Trichoderma aggressivum f. europaeum]|uniref:Nucleoside phosphorylase domain-containing protein n=1 Tax=Trichoderma aggressivum f. europaeum TaxID=173218 RepID=A0AAE1ILL0_9HYPO|nr:hypothetical protein Triagg1_581 [Trichoderma aggressivum f. europaeum]
MQRSPYSNDEYTIGWISALHEEFMLAMAMLDEEHGRPQSTPRDDTNAYHLGKIGEHNITMACLSGGQMGTGPAAIVAENMRRTFKNIKFALLVGIGGGVPGEKKDIRLGDIVVSYPNGTYTGVVQYDYGKLNGSGDIERKDWFCAPAPKILATVDLLKAYHSRPKNPRNNIPGILNELGEQYTYPEEHATPDLLFEAECDHNIGAETCDSCDKEALVQRRVRNSASTPHIHYGIIASGSMVVRNGVERNKIDSRYANTIFCFDMEAAGLMNNFPCLIIRGISDYSDSHKNDQWRKRAAAVASAYAKELISLIEPSDVEMLPPIASRVLNSIFENIANIDENTAENTRLRRNAENEARKRDLNDQQIRCERWLNPPNVRQIHQERVEARLAGTCDWIWSHTTFINWKSLSTPSPLDGLLCICGPPGCGKSILASHIADHLREDGAYVLFFAFVGMNASHLKLDGKLDDFVRSLLSQLLQILPEGQAIRIVSNLMLKGQATSFDLWTAFSMIADTFITKPIYCIVDGVDESGNIVNGVDESINIVHRLVQKLLGFLQTHSSVRFIILGRSHVFHSYDSIKHKIEVDSILTEHDLDLVIETGIADSKVLDTPDLRTEVRKTLTEQSEGNFLWIKLMFGHLNGSVGVADALEKLHNLPRDIQTAYESLLSGLISGLNRSELNLAQKTFAFIIVARRPLRIEEFQYLFAENAMSASKSRKHPIEHYIPRPDRKILDVCGGLVSIMDGHLRLVHFSVMEFLTRPESEWESCEAQLFRVSLEQAHSWVAAASIEYLEMCYYSSQTHDWSKFAELDKHNQLLSYVSRYFTIHITQSDIKPDFITAKINKFLNSDRCVPWIEHFAMEMFDNESLHSFVDDFEVFISWLGDDEHSLELSRRVSACLNHEMERRSQQYGDTDFRTERIRLFLTLMQDESTWNSPQAVEPSLVGSVRIPTDMSPILQILRHEAPLSRELKANLCLKMQIYLRKAKQLADPLQIIFRILLDNASNMPIYALLAIGQFYREIRQFEQALKIYFAALDKVEEKETPLKYYVLRQIGYIYTCLNQYDEALEYDIEAHAGREEILGPEHKDTLMSLHDIGCDYRDLGEPYKALEYDRKAHAGREKILGPKHKHTLLSLNDTGCDYYDLGEYDKAIEYFTKAHAGREKILGPEHKDTLMTLHNIGSAYSGLGEYDKAVEYLTKPSLCLREARAL